MKKNVFSIIFTNGGGTKGLHPPSPARARIDYNNASTQTGPLWGHCYFHHKVCQFTFPRCTTRTLPLSRSLSLSLSLSLASSEAGGRACGRGSERASRGVCRYQRVACVTRMLTPCSARGCLRGAPTGGSSSNYRIP